jgi:hypothetical protein
MALAGFEPAKFASSGKHTNHYTTNATWQVYANKPRVMPFIPTKSAACMSTSWLLGNVYTAKSCKGKKRDPDALYE